MLFLSALAMAQIVPPIDSVDQAVGLLPAIMAYVAAGKWLLVAGGGVMIATVLFRQFVLPKLNLSTNVLPYVSMILSALAGIGSYVYGGVDAKSAAVQILISGPLAGQLWNMLGKQVSAMLLKALGSQLHQPAV
jgi:hypothetical protein